MTKPRNSGAGSLRQAILDANANPGADQIGFNIPGAGVREFKEIDEFRIHLFTADGRQDEIEVLVEIPERDGANAEGIIVQLGKSLSQAHEGLRFGVKKVANGSLPRFELKAKRLQDDRIVIGSAGERRATA